MPHCPRCDTELHPAARFCVQCGAAVADVPDAPEGDPGHPAGAEDGDEVTDLSMPTGGDHTRVVEVELQDCPRCGASNAARRTRCGRCGARLAGPAGGPTSTRDPRDTPPTGQAVPRPAPAAPPSQPTSDVVGSGSRTRDPRRRRRRRRAVATAFVAGGLLVGAAIGVAAGSGLGPFASPVQIEFDAASYPDDPAALRPVQTGATSTHPRVDSTVFGPTLAVDDDRTTAWAPQSEDTDARLVHHFEQPVWIDHIEVASGLPDEAQVDGIGRVTGATIDLRTFRVDASIADSGGMQVIQLQEPVLVEDVTWQVTSASGGTGALAEVRYSGWPADQADQDALQGR